MSLTYLSITLTPPPPLPLHPPPMQGALNKLKDPALRHMWKLQIERCRANYSHDIGKQVKLRVEVLCVSARVAVGQRKGWFGVRIRTPCVKSNGRGSCVSKIGKEAKEGAAVVAGSGDETGGLWPLSINECCEYATCYYYD
jgi:hypothetical protein